MSRNGAAERRGPFVGRLRELAVLADLTERVAAGQGGLALIEGEPGIGKSTLVQAAFADYGGELFWGTASELDEALPLQPLLDALRVRAAPGSEPDPRRAAIARFLRGETGTDRGMDSTAMLAEQLLALVAEECERPVILVIDDVQWADRASLRLLRQLAGLSRQLPLLLVMMMRLVPQREEIFALFRSVRDATRLRLAGLPEDDVAALVAALVGGAPGDDLLRVARDAAGNPLYLTELIAALTRSDRVSVTENGVAALASGSARTEDQVPASLSAAIADRLGFISERTRAVLSAACLLGPEFDVTDLAIVLNAGAADLDTSLREARAAGIVAESGTHLRFRHPLIHTALYEELPGPVRASRHRAACRALAAAGPLVIPADRVARQLVLAVGDLPFQLDEWELGWLSGAAELLVTRAPQAVARLLSPTVAGLPEGSAERDLLASRLADALYRTGDRAQAEQVASRELAHVIDRDAFVALHWTLAQCRIVTGESARSLATLEDAMMAPGLSGCQRGRLLVLAARTYLQCGELAQGVGLAGIALAEAERARDVWVRAWALHTMAGGAVLQGRLAQALPLFDRALEVTEADDALTDLHALLQINNAVALATLDRYAQALEIAGQARKLAQQVGSTVRLTQARSLAGQVLYVTGRWDEALAEFAAMPESVKERIAVCDELGVAALISFYRGDAAAAHGHLAAAPHADLIGHRLTPLLTLARSADREHAGDLPGALATLTDWLAEDTEETGQIREALPDAVRLAVRVGQQDTARALTTRVEELAATGEIPSAQADALYCRGLVDDDGSLLLEAAQRYRDAGRPFPCARALEAAAAALARADDAPRTQAALSQAAEIRRALGLPLSLADADA